MKIAAFICLLSLMLSFLYGSDNDDNQEILIAPDFIQSFYDHYTVNMHNSRALGMGNTSVALRGGVEYALVNPASFRPEPLDLYFEGNVKNEVKEMNIYVNKEEPDKADSRQNLEGGLPAVAVGIGHPLTENFSLGASFSMPQTIRYNVFARRLKTGVYVDRFPTMRNYQGTLTTTGHFGNFSAGLNMMLNHYTFDALRIEYTFDRIARMNETLLRFQPGLLYANDRYSVGFSYKLPTDHTFDLKNDISRAPSYHTYDVTMPGVLEAGASYNLDKITKLALALTYEQTSQQYEGFDDRLQLKTGIERNFDNYTLRGGLMHIPGIYSGRHDTVKGGDPPSEHDLTEFDINYDYLVVDDTDQLFLTGGVTYHLSNVDFSIAAAADMLGNVDVFQLSCSFDIKLGAIMRETRDRQYR